MEITTPSGIKLNLIVVEDHDATAGPAADLFATTISEKLPEPATILFATGSTPLPMYKELVRRHKENGFSFKDVHAFMLDEYIGLPMGHPACFRTFINEHLYRHVDLKQESQHYYFGPPEDHMQTCFRYEQELAEAGGVDLALLGIGRNGHIAFNEPGTRADSRTRMIRLSESTRQANARFFSSLDEVPTQALSLGIGNIMESKAILLIAAGQSKSAVLKAALTGPITDQLPASYLQTFKGKLTVVADKQAAAELQS
jgi:glucosamine-6-phosphate deaminase